MVYQYNKDGYNISCGKSFGLVTLYNLTEIAGKNIKYKNIKYKNKSRRLILYIITFTLLI